MDCTRHHDCANFSPMKCPNFTPKPAPRWPHPDKPDPTVVPPESRVVTEGWGVGSMPGRIPDGSSRSDRALALGYPGAGLSDEEKARRRDEICEECKRVLDDAGNNHDDTTEAARITRDRKLAELDAL